MTKDKNEGDGMDRDNGVLRPSAEDRLESK